MCGLLATRLLGWIDGGMYIQTPATIVHGDYTVSSAPARLEQLTQPPKQNDAFRTQVVGGGQALLTPDVLERARRGRFAIVNVWRNIQEMPVEVYPLACCDAATVEPEDLCVFEIHYSDRVGETYFAAHNSRHRWLYFPHMMRDEAILLKQWDSWGTLVGGERSTMAMHSAFADPTSSGYAADRESIEVRCICIFDVARGAGMKSPLSKM